MIKEKKKPKTRNLKKENKEKKEEDVNTNIGENTSLLTNDLIINIITIIIILLICLFFISLLQTKNRNLKTIPDNTSMKKLKLVNIILSKLN